MNCETNQNDHRQSTQGRGILKRLGLLFASRLRHCLLGRRYLILHSFGHSELHNLFRLDLDLFAGLQVRRTNSLAGTKDGADRRKLPLRSFYFAGAGSTTSRYRFLSVSWRADS